MRSRLRLGWPILVALALRIALVLGFSSSAADGEQYVLLGRNLRLHRTLSLDPVLGTVPTYARNPGYPAVIAAMGQLDGSTDRLDLIRHLALLNCACDALTCAALLLIALRLGLGRRAAVVAGLVYALWPVAWWFTPYVLTESLATALGTWALAIALGEGRTLARGAAVGALLGVGYLVRVDVLTLLPAAAIALAVRGGGRRLQAVAALGLGVLLVAAPWWARNLARFGALRPIGSEWVDRYGHALPTCYTRWFRTWCAGRAIDGDYAGALFWRYGRAGEFVYSFMADGADALDELKALTARVDTPLGIEVAAPSFCALADERAREHPLRTWLGLPLRRARQLFLLPRAIEYPMRPAWLERPRVRVALGALNVGLWGLAALAALLGLRRVRQEPLCAVLPVAIVARVVLHAYAVPQFVGPRFVVEAAPLAAVLIAQLGVLMRSSRRSTL